ncbi:MAG: hypothetical protein WBV88_03370 [Candidatus Rickettsiella isopodorum]|jgi:hypothetical protein|nr:hypothetical protein [Candidatus Rickettsiella isopodorum]MDD5162389.1 hypothetical protein [Candidatus Rickettsiella isopodorum]
MTLTTEQQQFEENFKRGIEEGRRNCALKIAKRMLAMRNDQSLLLLFYIVLLRKLLVFLGKTYLS